MRNKEFRNQIRDVYSRYLVNSHNIIKTQRKSVSEKIYMNEFLVFTYPDFANKQKVQLEKKQEWLEKDSKKENINFYEIMNQKYEGFEYLDQIKVRREQLEKEVMETKKMLRKSNSQAESNDRKYLKEFKDIYGTEYYEKKPPLAHPVQETTIQPNSERELLDDFIIPNGKEQKSLYSYQPEVKEVKNLQQYIPINVNPPRQQINQQPKQSMLDKFLMKGSSQNLNVSFKVTSSVRADDPKKTLSSQRNKHNNSAGGFGTTGQINFQDSRENSPDYGYQQNYSPNKPPKSNNNVQQNSRNIENINYPQQKRNDMFYSLNRKKFE